MPQIERLVNSAVFSTEWFRQNVTNAAEVCGFGQGTL